jgi:hypothetical protein
MRSSMLTHFIPDRPSQKCKKTRFNEISPTPDKAYARHHDLHEGAEAPDLATVKDFFHFYIATSYGRIITKPTVDSIKTITKWFFTSFTRITGTPIMKKTETRRTAKTLYLFGGESDPSVRQALPGDGAPSFPVMFRPCAVPANPTHKPTI